MKKMLYFIPTIVVLICLVFVLTILSGPANQLSDYITGTVIVSIFAVSDWLLSKKKWFGCLPGMLLGAYIIYYGSQYHGQVFDERPVGMIISLYYLVLGIFVYRKGRLTNLAK